MRLKKFAPGALKWGAATSQIPLIGQNPYALAGASLLGGFLESMSGPPQKMDTKPYYDALKRYSDDAMNRSRRTVREMGSQMGASLAGRGINDSNLAAFLTQQNQGRIYGRTIDNINQMHGDLDMQLAHADNLLNLRNEMDSSNMWGEAGDTIFAALANRYAEDGSETLNPQQLKVLEGAKKWLTDLFGGIEGAIPPDDVINFFSNKKPETTPAPTQTTALSTQDLPNLPGITEGRNSPALNLKQQKPKAPSMLDRLKDTKLQKARDRKFDPKNPFGTKATTPAKKIENLTVQLGQENMNYIMSMFTNEEIIDAFEWS